MIAAAIASDHTRNAMVFINDQILNTAFKDGEVFLLSQDILHRLTIQLAVGLRTRSAHSRALGTIEHTELNASPVNRTAHHPVQRIDFADHMPLAQTTDGRVTGHFPDAIGTVRNQCGVGPHAGSRSRGFATGMAATNHNHIKTVMLLSLRHRLPHSIPRHRFAGSNLLGVLNVKHASSEQPMFHVKHFLVILFADTEVAEDNIKQVFYIDTSGNLADFPHREAYILSSKFGDIGLHSAIQMVAGTFKCPAVPQPCQGYGTGKIEPFFYASLQQLQEAFHPLPSHGRYGQNGKLQLGPARRHAVPDLGNIRTRKIIDLVDQQYGAAINQTGGFGINGRPVVAVNHHKAQIGIIGPCRRTPHAFGFNHITTFAQAGGINHGDGEPA